MAWDFSTDPEFQEQLDWMTAFVREEIWPLETLDLDADALDRAIAPLESPFAIDHRSAFFSKAERRQESGRRMGRFIRQNIHDNKDGEGPDLGKGKANVDRIFAESDQCLHPA